MPAHEGLCPELNFVGLLGAPGLNFALSLQIPPPPRDPPKPISKRPFPVTHCTAPTSWISSDLGRQAGSLPNGTGDPQEKSRAGCRAQEGNGPNHLWASGAKGPSGLKNLAQTLKDARHLRWAGAGKLAPKATYCERDSSAGFLVHSASLLFPRRALGSGFCCCCCCWRVSSVGGRAALARVLIPRRSRSENRKRNLAAGLPCVSLPKARAAGPRQPQERGWGGEVGSPVSSI